MPAIFVTPQVNLARYAGALFGVQLGAAYTKDLISAASSLSAQTTLFNDVYSMSFGTTSTKDVAATIAANLGLTGASATAAATYLEGQLTATSAAGRGAAVSTILNLFAGLTADATFGAAATAWNDKVTAAVEYGKTAAGNSVFGTSLEFNLVTGLDQVTGTSVNDVFTAYLAGNSNTLESGDKIDGGAGTGDMLNAVLGDASNFAITPIISNVETISLRAQSNDANGNSGSNNVTGNTITLDAEKISGVTNWNNSNSRADLTIEDVRIANSQITKDITITMADTDPGSTNNKTDFEFYFSPESLRKSSPVTQNSTITLTLNDNKGYAGKEVPTLNIIVNFKLNGVDYSIPVNSAGADATVDATYGSYNSGGTYDQFVTNLNAAFAKYPALATVKAVVGGSVPAITITRPDKSVSVQATPLCKAVVITDSAGNSFSAQGFQTATGGSTYSIDGSATIGTPTQIGYLITSTIVLDNVGREAEAGHLIVGGMGTRTGVERFEVTVNNNDNASGAHTDSGSWLSDMSSTNNQLREVTVKNDAVGIASPDYLYLGTNTDQAGNNLTTIQAGYTAQAAIANGPAASFAPGFLRTDGLTDVRLFDASAMKGAVKVGASVTANTVVKYQDLLDSAFADKTDDIAFVYSTGDGNDSINLAIDGSVAASNSNINPGRHDFTFTANGGAGNDNIKVQMTSEAGNTAAWYGNQKVNANVAINAGTGDDTVYTPGAGDVIIDLGAGNDTVYTDNTGTQAVAFNGGRATWVFNSTGNATNGVANVNDLQGQTAVTAVKAVNLSLVVTYRGLTSTVVVGNSKDALTGASITDLTINQAIKDAINNNATLNKLLVAEDGAGRSLVVRSLIDGAQSTSDIAVSLLSTALGAGQIAAALTDTSVALITDANALTLGFAGVSSLANAASTNGRFADVLGSDLTTTSLSVASTTEGAVATQEVHTISSVSAVTTIVNAGSDTFTSAGKLSITAEGTTYSVNVAATSTVAAAVAALNALGNNKVTFTSGADAGNAALDTIVVTSNTNGNKSISSASFTALTTITGANSISTSDNTITGGTEDDVIVLGTTDNGATLLGSSNELVKFAAAWGNDVIVNFSTSTFGVDKLDFRAFLGTTATSFGAVASTDSLVTIAASSTATLTTIKALYTDDTTANKAIYIAYNGQVGSVYSVVDGTAASDLAVTLLGTITLASPVGTANGWAAIGSGNLS